MKKIIGFSYIFIIISLVLVGCGNKPVYQNTVSFTNEKWPRIEEGKEIKFEKINIKSVEDTYDINVLFRFKKSINVDEITFILNIISPSGISKESTHTIKLKDREGVNFLGSDLGEIVEIKEIIKQYTTLPELGEYTIKISNYSSKYELTGIENITIEVIESNLDYEIEK